jgi:hypothetical protein
MHPVRPSQTIPCILLDPNIDSHNSNTPNDFPTTSFAGWSKPVQPGASDFQARPSPLWVRVLFGGSKVW